jgi:radical SAM superfamily enzyme YgiQ (UPF0313 family)
VAIEAYVTSANRAYRLADHYRSRGAHVCLGGLHPSSLPEEAARHADSLFIGPGEDTWPAFLADFRAGRPQRVYRSTQRTLEGAPPPRRELIKRHLYLAPNALTVSRGCPHHCEFCYKDSFFQGGKSFYVQAVDAALAEIDRLPGKHLFFMDDHLFGDAAFVGELLAGMRGLGRVWQAAGTVQAALKPGLMEHAADAGLRSLFVGFETLNQANLRGVGKNQNWCRDYDAAIARLHDLGVMVNASFIFGLDDDDRSVFARTVDWAISRGIETTTFHILTPYPGTALHERLAAQGRILHRNWDLYDTRHAVFRPAQMSPEELEAGYWRAYRDFYRWGSILRSAWTKGEWIERLRHVAYAGAWKKAEPLWHLIINAGRVSGMLPALEWVLNDFGRGPGGQPNAHPGPLSRLRTALANWDGARRWKPQ